MERIERVLEILNVKCEELRVEYAEAIIDGVKGYAIERIRGRAEGVKECIKQVEEYAFFVKKLQSPRTKKILDDKRIEFIYESKMNYEKTI